MLEMGGGERRAIVLHEINKRPEQFINLQSGKTLGQILHTGSHVIDLRHDHAEVGLLRDSNCALSVASGAPVLPKSSDTKFCPIKPVNLTVAMLSVRTCALRFIFMITRAFSPSSRIFSTRPTSLPAIFTRSPTFSSWTLGEQRGQVVTPHEMFRPAEHLDDDHRRDDRQGNENAQPAFPVNFS